jgi:hypothetical protein
MVYFYGRFGGKNLFSIIEAYQTSVVGNEENQFYPY